MRLLASAGRDSGRRGRALSPTLTALHLVSEPVDIYVGNLPYEFSDQELSEVFAPFGEVVSAKIILDRETGRSKGFGFVTMSNDEEANAAVAAMDGAEIAGRPAKVNSARPREERPRRTFSGPRQGGFGGGGGGGGFGGGRDGGSRGGDRRGGGGFGGRGDRDGGGRSSRGGDRW